MDEVRGCLPWPAVSQSWSLTVLSSKYIVLERKSIPIVAWYVLSNESYMNLNATMTRDVTDSPVDSEDEHKPGDKRGFTDWLFAEKDQLEFAKRISKVRGHFFLNIYGFCTFSLFKIIYRKSRKHKKRERNQYKSIKMSHYVISQRDISISN